MKRPLFFSCLLLLGVTARCGHEQTRLHDVLYLGAATDEAYLALLDAEAAGVVVDDARAPVVSAPAEGQALDAATAPTLAWTAGFVARARPGAPAPRPRSLPMEPWGGGIAYAHLPPLTGAVFLLRFRGAGAPVVVLTTESTFTPTPEVWARLTALGSALELEITGAFLRLNLVAEGPYRATTNRRLRLAAAR